MPILDFFRNLLGRGSTQEPPPYRFDQDPRYTDSFRNPIWQTDEDDDDVSDFSRQSKNRYQFRIFSDPFEMTRFFETQMDDMMRNFFGFDGFGNFFGGNWRPAGIDEFTNALPMPDNQPNTKGPRDEVLKPSYDAPTSSFGLDDFTNMLPLPDRKNAKRPCEEVLKPSYAMPDANAEKLDSDIDGKYVKIKSDQLAKIWTSPSEDVTSSKPQFSIRTFGSSVSTQFVKRPDGSVEQRRTVRDSEGNEEIVVTRQIGDKVHTVTTKKSKDGSEVKSEDIVNMNESELKGFDEKWSRTHISPKEDMRDNFPWYKFFGPKL